MALISLFNPYTLATTFRNYLFDSGRLKVEKADVPIISIGNITTGGTGKTPFVRLISSFFRNHRFTPAVISRGYGRSTRGLVVVNDGYATITTPDEAGDELLLHASDGIAIAAEKRILGCKKAKELGAKICILDDGFQHRQLYRDIDIVLIDAETIRGKMLPFGRLRESLSGILRAHVLSIDEKISKEALDKLKVNPNSLIIRHSIKSGEPYLVNNYNSSFNLPQNVVAVSSIANPQRFFHTASYSFSICSHISLPDHAHYTEKIIKRILDVTVRQRTDGIVITEKDAVKIRQYQSIFSDANVQVIALPIETVITEGCNDFYDCLLSLIPSRYSPLS